jgi:hypothetical protein
MISFLCGAIVMAYAVAGLFFLRFWRKTGDSLFAMFAAAFWILSCQAMILPIYRGQEEVSPFIYTIRLAAFVIIIAAILNKNRKVARSGK